MKLRAVFRLPAVVLLAAGLTSCASVSVQNIIPLEHPSPAQMPQGIFVRPFEFDEGTVRVDREGRELREFKKAMQDQLMADLVARLRKHVAPADGLPETAAVPPGNYWVITGKFTRVNQGSRALRSTVGFGTGGTKVDVSATVSDHTPGGENPFVLIQTTGGSNAMPGAIMGLIAWPMVLHGGEGLIAGVSTDTRRTAREITAGLADFLRKHGVPVSDKVPKPKMKGQLPSLPKIPGRTES